MLFTMARMKGIDLPPPGRRWLPLAILAVLGSILPFQLTAWAQQFIDSSTTGILMAAMPLFVMTLSHYLLPGGQLTVSRSIGFVFGFAGVTLVIGPEALSGLGESGKLLGMFAVLGAVLSYSFNSVYARRMKPENPLALSAGMLVVASLLSVSFSAGDYAAIRLPIEGLPLLAILVLGFLSTGLATVLYFRLVQGPGPNFLTTVNYLVPVWAVLLGAVALDEKLEPAAVGGLVLILGGILISELGGRLVVAVREGRGFLQAVRVASDEA
jgi:drug/metabolite transporter (DMT)-like permease